MEQDAEADKKSGPAPEADKPAKRDYDELLPQAVDVILDFFSGSATTAHAVMSASGKADFRAS